MAERVRGKLRVFLLYPPPPPPPPAAAARGPRAEGPCQWGRPRPRPALRHRIQRADYGRAATRSLDRPPSEAAAPAPSAHRHRACGGSRAFAGHAVEDRERRHLALALDLEGAGPRAQRADDELLRRFRGAPRLLLCARRPRRLDRAARDEVRPPLRAARPFALRRYRGRALPHHPQRGRRTLRAV